MTREVDQIEAKSADSTIWPSEIRVNKEKDQLYISFTDGAAVTLTAEYLRTQSPSAEVQGHNPSEKQTVPGKKNVQIASIEKTGNYAIRILFNDGHDTGIYSWDYLHLIGSEHETRWAEYLQELADKGLAR